MAFEHDLASFTEEARMAVRNGGFPGRENVMYYKKNNLSMHKWQLNTVSRNNKITVMLWS
jgi:hypothetical protein